MSKKIKMETKKKKITNRHYRHFLDNGEIRLIDESDIDRALSNVTGIRGKYKDEGRALLICLYYTGARPNEVLRIKSKDITKKNKFVLVRVSGSKGGLPRTIYLPYNKKLVKEFYHYSLKIFEEMYLFYNYWSKYKYMRPNKKGPTPVLDISNKLRHYFNQWFKGVLDGQIPPYYLRHNRFSKLAEAGVEMQDIRMLKGSKTFDSITPYLHLSARSAQRISRKMD